MGNRVIKAKYISMFIIGMYIKSLLTSPVGYIGSTFEYIFGMIACFSFGVYLAASEDLDRQKLKIK